MYRVKVIDGGRVETFPSVVSAAKATGIYRTTIRKHMVNGEFSVSCLTRGPKPVSVRNDRMGLKVNYPSIIEASKSLGVSVDTIRRRIDDGRWLKTEDVSVKVAFA